MIAFSEKLFWQVYVKLRQEEKLSALWLFIW